MGKAQRPQRVKLVIGMFTKDKKLFDKIEKFFIKEFGKTDYKSPVLLFDHTDYYKKEMGHPLKKRFISFKKLIPPENIAKVKVLTNLVEDKFSEEKNGSLNRQINIDPGYITDAKFILATTKDYCHRTYLSKGIYAEVAIRWKKNSFQSLEWTYPDYRTEEYINILNTIRNSYMKERKSASG